MKQKEWYEKLLNWAETDNRLDDMHQMQLVVLAEHLANEESGLTKRAPDCATHAPECDVWISQLRPCTCGLHKSHSG